jgi:hypothetical protein
MNYTILYIKDYLFEILFSHFPYIFKFCLSNLIKFFQIFLLQRNRIKDSQVQIIYFIHLNYLFFLYF